MKKFLILLLCVTISLPINVFASNENDETEFIENVITYQISEYDEIIKYRNSSSSEIECYQLSNDEYDMYTSNYIENKLMELKNKSDSELYDYGYTDDQISILRNYNGDRLENSPQMRSVMSTLTISFSGIYHYTYLYKVKANWYWSTMPLSFTTTNSGTAVFGWLAAGPGGSQIYSKYNISSSYCTVWYYSNGNIVKTYNSPMNVINQFACVSSTHETKLTVGWAKSGEMVLQVNNVDGGTITEMSYTFGYAHHKATITPSISVSTSLDATVGILFGSGMVCDGLRSCSYDQYGNFTQY